MGNASMLENGRAKYAYDCAEEWKTISEKDNKDGRKLKNVQYKKDDKYKSYVKNIPMMIKINGLGATFAFILSKSENKSDKEKNAYNLIYQQTTGWVKEKFPEIGDRDLVDYIISKDSNQYRAITVEVLAFFSWLRRFADGLIKGDN